ncbi:probable aspartyl aminopeptidase [Tanacetum coccineum]|uniref:Probable aspartyl aminopeptidase n=1 Tax=Tanacetum coccineum TaxID=301880 RepID=A0ABQ5G6H0_9ASTR
METERVTEFPMSQLDLRLRKRQRLGWDVVATPPKITLSASKQSVGFIIYTSGDATTNRTHRRIIDIQNIRGVNDGFKVNAQTHLAPVLATYVKAELNKRVADNSPDGGKPNERPNDVSNQKHHSLLLQMLATQAGCKSDDICDFELQACDTQPSIIAGAMKEFIFSGRLDNLCMSFCSLKALIDATVSEKSLEDESVVRMVALFDHEEVGSSSAQGAGSPVMFDALNRITTFFSSNPQVRNNVKAIQRSFLVSADMAHALHPNYMDKHEENHQPKLLWASD